MKIVQVCGWYFPDSLGGTETYVEAVASRLRAAGHHVVIAAPDPGALADRTYRHEGVPVYRYPIVERPTRDEAQHVVPVRGAERFHAWLREIRPDIVHFHTFATGVGPHEIEAARAAGARVFATVHTAALGFLCQRGTLMKWGERVCEGHVTPAACAACALQHRGMPKPLAMALGLVPGPLARVAAAVPGPAGTLIAMSDVIRRNARLQQRIYAGVERFVVLADWARRVVQQNGSNGLRLTVNRLGIRFGAEAAAALRARPRERRDVITVAYVGRFEGLKGVHDLARAIRALPTDLPLRFEFRGPVNNLRELAVANELKAIVGPDRWVRFGPPVAPSEVLEYLHSIDVLCCPSRTLEGGPTVALEAMAVGTPVLGTAAGAMAEVITDNVDGRLVPPGNWRALRDALLHIARDRENTVERWRTALPRVRTMDAVVSDYVQMYER